LDTPGASDREIAACRAKADIIVTSGEPLPGENSGFGSARTFQDLQLALGKYRYIFVFLGILSRYIVIFLG